MNKKTTQMIETLKINLNFNIDNWVEKVMCDYSLENKVCDKETIKKILKFGYYTAVYTVEELQSNEMTEQEHLECEIQELEIEIERHNKAIQNLKNLQERRKQKLKVVYDVNGNCKLELP